MNSKKTLTINYLIARVFYIIDIRLKYEEIGYYRRIFHLPDTIQRDPQL